METPDWIEIPIDNQKCIMTRCQSNLGQTSHPCATRLELTMVTDASRRTRARKLHTLPEANHSGHRDWHSPRRQLCEESTRVHRLLDGRLSKAGVWLSDNQGVQPNDGEGTEVTGAKVGLARPAKGSDAKATAGKHSGRTPFLGLGSHSARGEFAWMQGFRWPERFALTAARHRKPGEGAGRGRVSGGGGAGRECPAGDSLVREGKGKTERGTERGLCRRSLRQRGLQL